MSGKNKKQFGVWMDSASAIVAGRADGNNEEFVILDHVKGLVKEPNSNENAANNKERADLHKFFKDITSVMQNADEVHVTGPGTVQEQFIHYLAETPQFKNTVAKQTSSSKMTDEKVLDFVKEQFH